ncbi:methanol oxidation system protein MoxJ [Algihabitans albus]|uniref:methanol oxidation system protein MoxJ n=1 Tax=Algihabitans albus TaxID=2164067 RepID=UPI000E5C970C|nr:methanol oxidation system protein MoxJ [Algihabitans albus]
MGISKVMRRAGLAAAALVAAASATAAGTTLEAAADPATDMEAEGSLRVCSSTQDAPFSDADATGFENRIAGIVAEAMGRELEHVWIDKAAIYLVRDGIDDGKCDVVMGVDQNDPRLLTSIPYYRTSYVFVSREDRGFDGEKWQDADTAGIERFSYRFHSPAETILKYSGKYENNLAYSRSLINFKSRRNQYINVPAERVVAEVVDGHADVAIAFASAVARYVTKASTPLRMQIITNDIERLDGKIIPLTYAQSIGVAKRVPDLVEEINAALQESAAEIRAVLEEEGVPLLPLES